MAEDMVKGRDKLLEDNMTSKAVVRLPLPEEQPGPMAEVGSVEENLIKVPPKGNQE